MSTTYDRDLTVWAKDTAQLLRERCWDAIDWEHLIEEVEDLGKSERSAIASQMERIMVHLLKWQYQRRSRLWKLESLNINYNHLNSAIAKRVRFYQSYGF